QEGDWISQRNDVFGTFIPLGNKDDKSTFFQHGLYCRGLETARDSWVYNSDLKKLKSNIETTINFYNSELKRFNKAKQSDSKLQAVDFVSSIDQKISWSRAFVTDIVQNRVKKLNEDSCRISTYRPFFK